MAGQGDPLTKWQQKWREANFTWEGLSKHKLEGWTVAGRVLRDETGRHYGQSGISTQDRGRPATLQDYWRADPQTGHVRDDAAVSGELTIRPGQPNYHLVHLPLTYDDGTPTGKQDWHDDALDALLSPRLLAEGEAQFQGGVWLKAARHPNRPTLNSNYQLALFCRDCNFAHATFGPSTQFAGAAFCGTARFDGAVFNGHSSFENSVFVGGVHFSRAEFRGG